MAKKNKKKEKQKGYGKTDVGAVKKDVKKREKERADFDRGFTRFYKFRVGFNFMRILPPLPGRALPWEKALRHFNLGPEGNGFGNCALKGCPACSLSKALAKSKKKSDKKRAEDVRRSQGYYFAMIDVAPLYDLVNGKVKMVGDPVKDWPKCWGSIEYKDEDREQLSKKCAKCKKKVNEWGISWADSCELGVCACSVSGQRIDNIADGFDDGDFTDLGKEGRTVQTKRKGKSRFKTSYMDKVLSKEWALPRHIVEYVNENAIDLVELTKPLTKDEMKAVMEGRSSDDDTPDCFGEFDSDEEKCKECDLADLCAEEAGVDVDDEDEEAEEGEEDEEEDEEDEEEEGEEEDEEEDEEEGEDDEEDEDDEDEDEGDEDEEEDEEGDDEEEEDDDDEGDDEEDEEEDNSSAREKLKKELKKKSKGKNKKKEKSSSKRKKK